MHKSKHKPAAEIPKDAVTVPEIIDLIGDKPIPSSLMERPFSSGWGMGYLWRLNEEPERLVVDVGEMRFGVEEPSILMVGSDFSEVEEFSRRYSGAHITAADLDLKTLKGIQDRFTSMPALERELRVFDRLALYRADLSVVDRKHFPDESFDFVYADGLDVSAFEPSEAVGIVKAMLDNEVRMLKPGGLIFHPATFAPHANIAYYRRYVDDGILKPLDHGEELFKKKK